MKKITTLLIFATVLITLSLTLTSAHHSRLEQSTTSADRWYSLHQTGYDQFPSDNLILFYHDYPTQYNRTPRYDRQFTVYNPIRFTHSTFQQRSFTRSMIYFHTQ